MSVAAAVGVCTQLAGCIGVTDHYIDINPPKVDRFGRVIVDTSRVTLPSAIVYAETAKQRYKTALVNQGRLTTLTGAGLIPLGALTLGLAMGNNNPGLVTGLGLTGLGIYGVANWLKNVPAQRFYIAGYEAINCAIAAVVPLNIDPSNTSYSAFQTYLPALDAHIVAVQNAITNVSRLIANITAASALKTSAQAEVAAAQSLIASAVTARRSGVTLQLQLDTAGGQLRQAVDHISSQVDRGVLENQLDLAALGRLIGGLGQAYGTFTPVPPTTPKAMAGMPPPSGTMIQSANNLQRQITQAVQELVAREADLSITIGPVADFINAIEARTPFETLRACGVDPSSITAELTLSESGPITFVAGQAKSVGVVALSGRPPYASAIAGQSLGIKVTQNPPFGPYFLIESGAETVAGETSVTIFDSASPPKPKTIPITVSPKPAAAAGTATRAATGTRAAAAPATGASVTVLANIVAALMGASANVKGATVAVMTATVDPTNRRLNITLVPPQLPKATAEVTAAELRDALLGIAKSAGVDITAVTAAQVVVANQAEVLARINP